MYHVYSIPIQPILKVFFSLFQKFFCLPARLSGRSGGQAAQGGQPSRRPQQQRQRQPAQGEQVDRTAQKQGGHVEHLDLPVPPGQGEGEQQHGGPQPEQQVQAKGQPAPAKLPAQRPQPVVHKPQCAARQHRLAEGRRLGQDVHPHGFSAAAGRKSRPGPRPGRPHR